MKSTNIKQFESSLEQPGKHPLLIKLEKFQADLKVNEGVITEEQMRARMAELERYSAHPDRKIKIYTDPELDTFCCIEVPSKRVTSAGEIEDEKGRKTYLIGVPFEYVQGGASREFMLGEVNHEQGHALFTDFARMARFRTLAAQEGYEPSELLRLDNCIEDPRQERVFGGPNHDTARKLLYEKNSSLIIPIIAEGLSRMQPVDQFRFLLKVEGLWTIYARDLREDGIVEKPWKIEELNEDVQKEFAMLKDVLAQLTGDDKTPPMKLNVKVEALIVSKFWPALKRLIDKYPMNSDVQNGNDLESAKPSKGGLPDEDEHFNPADPSTWPDKLKSILQKFVENNQNQLEKDAENQRLENERKKITNEQSKQIMQAMKKADGFENHELRRQYEDLKNRLRAQINQMAVVFQRYIPKFTEQEEELSRRGKNFHVQQLIRHYGSGHEKPLGKIVDLEKKGLVLQILVDVSGSMAGDRIENAVKAIIATCEAAQGRNIDIEILANDDQNLTHDDKYIIKAFNESYDGKVKGRIVSMVGMAGNDDAAAIRAALPRMKKQMQKMRLEAERSGALTIYISDSTTTSEETKAAADESRKVFPFEGTAISNESEIAQNVKFHFGPESIIPPNVQTFPGSFQKILQKHLVHLRSRG